VQHLKKTPLPSEWNRFDIFASRVRHLIYGHNERRRPKSPNYPAINLDVFRCLRINGKRLHHLRELDWGELDPDIFPYVDLFLGPHLVLLNLRLPKDPTPVDIDLCSSVKNLSPNISMLCVRHGWSDYPQYFVPQPVDELCLLACSLPHLTSININFPLTPEAIKYLSLLPNLTRFAIPNDAAEILKIIADAGLQRVFAGLTTLSLSVAILPLCIQFLSLIRPVHLKYLYVQCGPSYTSQAHDMRQLFIGIRDFCSYSQLERFTVSFIFNFGAEPLTSDMLEPLFAFRKLTVIEAPCPFSDFDNACLKRLAIAWPKLQSLVLHTRESDPSTISLEGLAELVERCPSLTTLTIELHISASNLENWKKTHGHLSNNVLWWLDLRRSTFHCDAGELGRLLHILFPKLTQFHARYQDPEYSWGDVARHLRLASGSDSLSLTIS
jgi:hypothetical protein